MSLVVRIQPCSGRAGWHFFEDFADGVVVVPGDTFQGGKLWATQSVVLENEALIDTRHTRFWVHAVRVHASVRGHQFFGNVRGILAVHAFDPFHLALFAHDWTLEERVGVCGQVGDESAEAFDHSTFGKLVFNQHLHRVRSFLRLFHDLVADFLLREFLHVFLRVWVLRLARLHALHHLLSEFVRDHLLHVWIDARLRRGGHEKRNLAVFQQNVTQPRLSAAALCLCDHHVDTGAALSCNGIGDRLFVLTVALAQGFEHLRFNGQLGPLSGLPEVSEVRSEAKYQGIVLTALSSLLRLLAGVKLCIVLDAYQSSHYLTLATRVSPWL